jgi:hypothetical protein
MITDRTEPLLRMSHCPIHVRQSYYETDNILLSRRMQVRRAIRARER